MLRRGFLICLLLFAAKARAREKIAETKEALLALQAGTLTPTQVANRISFAGTEAPATDALVLALRSLPEGKLRNASFEVLAQIATPHPELVPLAINAAHSTGDLSYRMNGLRVLGRQKQASTVSVLIPLLTDKVLGIRREAAKALVAINSRQAARSLLVVAKLEDDPEVRALMIVGVGKLGDSKQKQGLVPFLESSSESTRLAATQALCLLGSKKGIEAAKVLLASSDKYGRLQAAMLFEGAPLKLASPLLRPLLDDAEVSVRARAARLLAQGGDRRMVEWLVIESFKAQVDDRLIYETELELLRLPDDQRANILRKVGLR
jgi:HEAT repeat protein